MGQGGSQHALRKHKMPWWQMVLVTFVIVVVIGVIIVIQIINKNRPDG